MKPYEGIYEKYVLGIKNWMSLWKIAIQSQNKWVERVYVVTVFPCYRLYAVGAFCYFQIDTRVTRLKIFFLSHFMVSIIKFLLE